MSSKGSKRRFKVLEEQDQNLNFGRAGSFLEEQDHFFGRAGSHYEFWKSRITAWILEEQDHNLNFGRAGSQFEFGRAGSKLEFWKTRVTFLEDYSHNLKVKSLKV